jgi:predicted metal-dependent phosphoesterase TrpH
MNRALCDLHTHSHYSDGTDAPKELIEAAEALGLASIALCDHNTVSGLPEFLEAAEGKRVTAVPGIEISADHAGTELHILGLFLPLDRLGEVSDLMEAVQIRKRESNRALIEALCAAGYRVDYDAIAGKTPNGDFNRAHIAAALTEQGYTPSISAAFGTLLSEERGFYRPPARLDAYEVIDFLSSIGAVSVLAHPSLNLSEAALLRFLPKAKMYGLCGMETRYSLYDGKTEARMTEIAHDFDLCESGGSDYHGKNKPDICLMRGRGTLSVPQIFSEGLRARIKNQ